MSDRHVDCGAVIRELWDWLDSELDSGRLEAIRAHLAACRGCAAHEQFARSFLEHVRSAPPDRTDVEQLRARVMRVLASGR